MKQKRFFIVFEGLPFGERIKFDKKSHTCEEGGAHLRISFWHSLMNLKKKLLLKKTVKVGNKNKII